MAVTTDRIALVTGANKGIGLETARQLARQGILVLLGARDAGRGEEATRLLKSEGLNVEFLLLDVADEASIQRAVGQIEAHYGKLDILVNNAGVMLKEDYVPASQTSQATLRKTFETNFFGLIALTQALLPLIRKSEAGRIVNLSSILGSLAAQSTPGSPIYDAKVPAYDYSKTALNAFTVHLAYELKATPVKVNAAHPGWVKTDMGGEEAPMDIVTGAKTSVWLATLPADGPTGGYFHVGEKLDW